MHRIWISAGAVMGLAAVAISAWAAHAGATQLGPPRLATLQAGLGIHGWHAPALLAAGIWAENRGRLAHLAAGAMLVGLLLFLAGLYASALGGVSLGLAAPVGGVVLMLGWALLAVTALRRV